MAVAAHVYTRFAKSLADKLVQLETDTLKVTLHTSSYTPAQDTHQFQSDLTNELTTANGYTAGGATLSSVSLTESGHVYTLTCANPQWTTATFTAAFAVFADTTPGSAATNPLLCYWDFGGSQTAGGGTFTLQIASGGLVTFTGS